MYMANPGKLIEILDQVLNNKGYRLSVESISSLESGCLTTISLICTRSGRR